MDKFAIGNLVKEIERIEQDCIKLFNTTPMKASSDVTTDGDRDLLLIMWDVNDAQQRISREIRRRYDSWYHASLKFLEAYLPYQVNDFQSVYDVLISYITLSRNAVVNPAIIREEESEILQLYNKSYLNEFAGIIDSQANPVRSLLHLPEQKNDTPYRCFLTGFPAPYELRENPSLVFVIMPFSKTFDDIYQLGIKETVQSLGLQCKRSDEIVHTQNVICTSICQPIRAARYIIADITGQNANVFYELGLTHARAEDYDQKNKRIIIITQSMTDLPFDLRNMNIVHYESIGSLRTKLKTYLIDLIAQVSQQEA